MFKVLIVISTLLCSPAHAWWSWNNYDDYLMEQNPKYSFEQCQLYDEAEEDPEEVEYVLKCHQGQLEAHPVQEESEVGQLLKQVKLMEADRFEELMMNDFKTFVMSKIENSVSMLEKDVSCFGENASANCQENAYIITKMVKSRYPRMRKDISLSHRPSVYFGQQHSLDNPIYLNRVERDIEHPYHNTEIPRLSDEEARDAIRTSWQQEGRAARKYFEEQNVPLRCQSISKISGEPDLNLEDDDCRRMHFLGLNKARTSLEYEEREQRFKKDYSQLVGKMPFMPYMKSGDLREVSEEELKADIQQAYGALLSETKARLNKMKRWDLDDFKDLFR